MRGFLIKTGVALLIALMLHAAAGHLADGTTDPFYLRFTVPQQRSLVLGGSRAAQGIFPEVFNAHDRTGTFDGPLYNFAFTLAHSPYGPTYLKAIEQVLDTSARNGIFILQVDPWQLTDGKEPLPERGRSLGVVRTLGRDPNYEYLAHFYDRGWGALAHWPWGDPDTTTVLLANGRLKAQVKLDAKTVTERTRRRLKYYRDRLMPDRIMSYARLTSLGRTVELLRRHGTVVLVRLPASQDILALEAELDPLFDTRMEGIAREHGARYIDFSQVDRPLGYTDGVHLDARSGRWISEQLARNANLITGGDQGRVRSRDPHRDRIARRWAHRAAMICAGSER